MGFSGLRAQVAACVAIIMVSAACPTAAISAENTSGVETILDLDPYYTSVSAVIPLTDTPIPDLAETDEAAVYRRLMKNALKPRYILLEAAVYPMPIIGVYLKKNEPDTYRHGAIASDTNIIESVTAGFREPYSFSLFIGDVASFVKPGEKRVATNKGYMGWLFSYATEHIKDNVIIQDKSYELEWKLKGERKFEKDKQSWSFRLGGRFHDNHDIADTVYIGIRRSDLDLIDDMPSWLTNSSFDFKWEFAQQDLRPLRQEYVIGKKFPVKGRDFAVSLDFGVIWDSPSSYSGSLRDRSSDKFTLVFRPNIQF